MKKDYLLDIMRSSNTVFTTNDISLLWGETDAEFVRKKMYRYLKARKILSVRKGIYVKDKNYNKFELATKIFTPSYVGFETVLAKAGVIFQFYGQIFAASYLSREIRVDGQKYSFKKMKDSLLTNLAGIERMENYFIASPERAFLDTLYLTKDYYFDNLSSIDWVKVNKILPIYGNNKKMGKIVKKYQNEAQKEKKSKI